MRKTAVINFRVSEEIKKHLDKLEHINLSEYFRRVLIIDLAKENSDIGKQARLEAQIYKTTIKMRIYNARKRLSQYTQQPDILKDLAQEFCETIKAQIEATDDADIKKTGESEIKKIQAFCRFIQREKQNEG